MIAGCKKVQTFIDKSSGNFVNSGAYGEQPAIVMEVTNKTASEVMITVNENPDGGMSASGPIPVPAKSTRAIPMQVYNWKATGNVTVVGYKL